MISDDDLSDVETIQSSGARNSSVAALRKT
jgi:hypothetical protein